MWILSCGQLRNTCSKLNSFLVTVVALSTANEQFRKSYLLFDTYVLINKVLHNIHNFTWKKKFLPQNGEEGGGKGEANAPCPPPFSLALYYEHIMNICFSSKFAWRIPSVSSWFLHVIWSALSSLFPRHFFLLHQNENLFKSLKQWNTW